MTSYGVLELSLLEEDLCLYPIGAINLVLSYELDRLFLTDYFFLRMFTLVKVIGWFDT